MATTNPYETPTGLINTIAPVSATAAPNVVAQQGTAQTYTTQNATAAGNVYAGTAQAGTATGQGYTAERAGAETWTVDKNQTVQGQIENIIAKNSPLQQLAESRSLQRANERGLINSSMAVGEGQKALYDAALPIAGSDAAMYGRAGEFNTGLRQQTNFANQNAANTASSFTAGAQNQASITNAQMFTQVSQSNVANALQAGIVNQSQANAMAQFNANPANNANKDNAASANDMTKTNLNNMLQAGIINQQQANAMLQFNTGQTNTFSAATNLAATNTAAATAS